MCIFAPWVLLLLLLLTSRYSHLHTLCSICTLWYFYLSTCGEYFSFASLFTVTHTHTHRNCLVSVFLTNDRSGLQHRGSAPPHRWRHRGGKQRNPTEPESVRVLHGPPRFSSVRVPKLWTRAGSEQTRSKRGQTGSTTTPTRGHQLTFFLKKTGTQEGSRTRFDSALFASAPETQRKKKKPNKFPGDYLNCGSCLFRVRVRTDSRIGLRVKKKLDNSWVTTRCATGGR